jgi:hypothetical protein
MSADFEGTGLVQSESFKAYSGNVTPLLAHISSVQIHNLFEYLQSFVLFRD